MKLFKKGLVVIGIALSLISFTACSKDVSNDKYDIRNINIYREKSKVDKTMPIRFYEGQPHVPYVGIKEYFKEFYKKDLTVNSVNSYNVFSIGDKEYIKIDSNSSVLAIKDLFDLGHHPDMKENNKKFFLKLDSRNNSSAKYKLIDLSKYSIKVYNSNGETYVPFGMLNNLYGGIEMFNISYNGKDIYVLDNYGDVTGEERGEEYFADTYYDDISSKNDRYEDLAKYTYNQLCFSFDNLRGYTSQLVAGDNNLISIGLDELLNIYYPGVKRLLLSTNKEDYHRGHILLFGLMYDGGHTGMISKNPPSLSSLDTIKDNPEFKPIVDKIMSIDGPKMQSMDALYNAKASQLSGGYFAQGVANYSYSSEYKAAYISFDKFVLDIDLWDQYYKGDKSKLTELENGAELKDSYAFVRKSFYRAKEDGAENVIIDLTTNGGGSENALSGIFALMNAGKCVITKNNTVDSSREITNYSVDINLDGKYDEADIAEANSFKFNIVCLTSKNSFSCGNLLPALMKEKGYKITGEKSGGGSCAVVKEETAEGLIYNRSSYLCLCDTKGNNIDSGVELDLNLVTMNKGVKDVTKFFDYKTIVDYIKALNK